MPRKQQTLVTTFETKTVELVSRCGWYQQTWIQKGLCLVRWSQVQSLVKGWRWSQLLLRPLVLRRQYGFKYLRPDWPLSLTTFNKKNNSC